MSLACQHTGHMPTARILAEQANRQREARDLRATTQAIAAERRALATRCAAALAINPQGGRHA